MNVIKEFWNDTEGVGTIEIVLVLVVLVALVLIFRKRIIALIGQIFTEVENQANQVYGN